jgi:hypothetical protein
MNKKKKKGEMSCFEDLSEGMEDSYKASTSFLEAKKNLKALLEIFTASLFKI